MSVNKKLLIKSIILAIFCISMLTILLDFSRLTGSYNLYNAYRSDYIKRIIVILAATLVWLAGKDSLNKHYTQSMKVTFILICCGEVFFLSAKPAQAIGFYSVCQCLLILRHCRGLSSKLIKASRAQKLKLALSLLTLLLLLFFTIIIICHLVKIDNLLLMGIIYGFILSISMWVSLANYMLNLVPIKNSRNIVIGMLCFYFGDITVGLDGLLWPGSAWLIATSLTWVFYTPALTLLALSSYNYVEGLSISQKKLKSF